MRVLSLALVVATLASVCSPASALYTKKDAVVQLDPSNWEDEIGSSNEYWIVEFYAPWCAARVYQGRSQARVWAAIEVRGRGSGAIASLLVFTSTDT
jgi:hypothetical protein